ncbi:MAG: HutD family protein [Proteobacteria bacterium]|nr:HutD family protein [Pseudomonadota bacterium]MBS0574353.1 HutD family protein [Pseudomonadota bacterium]
MRIIRPEEFRTQPWKNGGGITHEIAREDRGGALLWRLSIAEVASDGPFSAFPGLSRILTVIEGAGLHLHTPEGRLDALPLAPLAFSGDLAVDSRMIGGPIRDFNVIYDGSRLRASVQTLRDSLPACPSAPGKSYALLALAPAETIGLPAGALALSRHFEACASAGFAGLLVTFTQTL